MRRLSIFLIGILSLSACSDQGKQFAATTDRVAGYVSTGLIIVDQQTSTGQMSAETGVAIVTALRTVNTLNGQLVTEAKNYVDEKGNLKLTGDGQAKLLAILDSSQKTIFTLINDERIVKLDPGKREQITLVTSNISATIVSLTELVKSVKIAKGAQ